MLKLVDAVVTVNGNKTTLDSLAAGRPLVCLSQQGEQYENAYRFQELGAAELPCPRRWDANKFASVVEHVATEDSYRKAANVLKEHIVQSGRANEAAALINNIPLG